MYMYGYVYSATQVSLVPSRWAIQKLFMLNGLCWGLFHTCPTQWVFYNGEFRQSESKQIGVPELYRSSLVLCVWLPIVRGLLTLTVTM